MTPEEQRAADVRWLEGEATAEEALAARFRSHYTRDEVARNAANNYSISAARIRRILAALTTEQEPVCPDGAPVLTRCEKHGTAVALEGEPGHESYVCYGVTDAGAKAMSKRTKRWYVVSVLAIDNSGTEEGGNVCHSLAFVAARGKDEAVGVYIADCLRERPGYLIKNVQCAPCPRSAPRPSTASTPAQSPATDAPVPG